MTTRRLLLSFLLLLVVATAIFIFLRYSPRKSVFVDLDLSSTAKDINRLTHLLASAPHRSGTESNVKVAKHIVDELKSAGLSQAPWSGLHFLPDFPDAENI